MRRVRLRGRRPEAVTRPLRALRAGMRRRRLEPRLAGPKLLRAFADAHAEAFFIEIGSNDGQQYDHLRPLILSTAWRGIMVEPVPYVFKRLRRNYGQLPRVALENAAIADRGGVLPFYHLRQAAEPELGRLPSWYDGIGSFSREKVLTHRHAIPDIEQRLTCTEVPCLTFESLCLKHAVAEIDLLAIDTEGHDAEILRQIDFTRQRPRLMLYEHFHLPEDERAACRSLLLGAGYELMEEGFDTWCLRTPAEDPLARVWRRLRPGVPGLSAADEAP